MKNQNIAQRLKSTLALIILMLLAGIGLTWWLHSRIGLDEMARLRQRDQLHQNTEAIKQLAAGTHGLQEATVRFTAESADHSSAETNRPDTTASPTKHSFATPSHFNHHQQP